MGGGNQPHPEHTRVNAHSPTYKMFLKSPFDRKIVKKDQFEDTRSLNR